MRGIAFLKTVRYLWAAPCSALGLGLGTILLAFGGRAKAVSGTLEIAFRASPASCGRLARSLPFRAITFGHVILAVTAQDLAQSRAHEWVHVRQYECWGVLFFAAYPASSLWQLLRGRNAYWDNHFEVEARALSGTAGKAARGA
jgi:hypothetical protein